MASITSGREINADLASPRSIAEDGEVVRQEEVEADTAEEGRAMATALPLSSRSSKLATPTAATRVVMAVLLLPPCLPTAGTVDNLNNLPMVDSLKLQAATDLLRSSKVATNLPLKAATADTSLNLPKATALLLKLATEDTADLLRLNRRKEAATAGMEDMVVEELRLLLRVDTVAMEGQVREDSSAGIEEGADERRNLLMCASFARCVYSSETKVNRLYHVAFSHRDLGEIGELR